MAVEDLFGGVDGLGAAGRVLEGGVEKALLHVRDAFLRQGVDADELHLLSRPAAWAARYAPWAPGSLWA